MTEDRILWLGVVALAGRRGHHHRPQADLNRTKLTAVPTPNRTRHGRDLMFTRFTLSLAVRLTLLVAEQTRRLREKPDAGMETADKILWAAAMTVVVSGVGAIFRDRLKGFASGLTITLGW